MPGLAAVVASTPHSAIRAIADLARQVPDAIRLETGDPDFTTPEHIIEAAREASRAGFTHYAPSAGLSSLRERIAEKIRARNGYSCEPDEVVVTAGACGGLFTTLLTILNPGDEVLIPDPGWPNYAAMLHVLNARSVRYRLDPAREWRPDVDQLAAAVGPRTRAVIVNSPANPTGTVLAQHDLQAILDIADRHDLWVLSDECYEELLFEGEHISTAMLGGRGRVVGVYSVSKTYAMTGWRIGYVVAPRAAASAIAKNQEPVNSCASTVGQKAAEAALTGPQDAVAMMREAYRQRRDEVLDKLGAAGVGYVRPGGAFYVMVSVGDVEPSTDFALRLLRERAVAVVPGSAFGPTSEGQVRVSLSVDRCRLHEGIDRLIGSLRQSGPVPRSVTCD